MLKIKTNYINKNYFLLLFISILFFVSCVPYYLLDHDSVYRLSLDKKFFDISNQAQYKDLLHKKFTTIKSSRPYLWFFGATKSNSKTIDGYFLIPYGYAKLLGLQRDLILSQLEIFRQDLKFRIIKILECQACSIDNINNLKLLEIELLSSTGKYDYMPLYIPNIIIVYEENNKIILKYNGLDHEPLEDDYFEQVE